MPIFFCIAPELESHIYVFFFFFKQKTAYGVGTGDWSSDVCSSDLIIAFHFPSSAGWQVLTDLVIVCGLAMLWMVQNARATGRTAWPYVLLTLAAGAFGPLLYLLMGSLRGRGASLASVRG